MTNVNTDSIDRGLVLGNKVLVAEVFAKNGFLVFSSATQGKRRQQGLVDPGGHCYENARKSKSDGKKTQQGTS